jgi:hypothetical protein
MPNGNTTPSRLGQINLTGGSFANDTALFLKKFAGEVLTSFTTSNVMKDLHTVRTISNGKSAQFPVTGIASSKYHVPGERITSNDNSYQSQIKANEVVINIDGLVLATTFIANIDEAMNHYDVRSIYSTELGRALAMRFDKQVMQAALLGTFGAPNVTGIALPTATLSTSSTTATVASTAHGLNVGDKVYINATSGTTADNNKVSGVWVVATSSANSFTFTLPSAPAVAFSSASIAAFKSYSAGTRLLDTVANYNTGSKLVAAIYSAAQSLDESNVPSEDRYCIVRPQDYYSIVQALADPSKPSPVGSFVTGDVAQIAGIRIVKSNNLPNGVITGETGQNNTYSGDFTGTRALIFQKGAIGTVKLMDLAVESEYEIELQGTILVSKYAMGHKALRPEGLISLVGY